jgi:hypothetical protein
MQGILDDTSVRDKLADYVTGRLSLRAFHRWFMPATWDVDGLDRLGDVVNQIKLHLAEFTNGHRTEHELKDALRPLVTSFPRGPEVRVTSGSAGRTVFGLFMVSRTPGSHSIRSAAINFTAPGSPQSQSARLTFPEVRSVQPGQALQLC